MGIKLSYLGTDDCVREIEKEILYRVFRNRCYIKNRHWITFLKPYSFYNKDVFIFVHKYP